jgi:cyclic beta-1,2-glucan synthetase
MYRPVEAGENYRSISAFSGRGYFGFYEALDFTATRLPEGKSVAVVRAYMAHHQGMSLVALDNVLHDDVMQRRFHADPRIKASELLLQERIPLGVPINPPRDVGASASAGPSHDDVDAVDHVGVPWMVHPRLHVLASGELSTMVSAAGTGRQLQHLAVGQGDTQFLRRGLHPRPW